MNNSRSHQVIACIALFLVFGLLSFDKWSLETKRQLALYNASRDGLLLPNSFELAKEFEFEAENGELCRLLVFTSCNQEAGYRNCERFILTNRDYETTSRVELQGQSKFLKTQLMVNYNPQVFEVIREHPMKSNSACCQYFMIKQGEITPYSITGSTS